MKTREEQIINIEIKEIKRVCNRMKRSDLKYLAHDIKEILYRCTNIIVESQKLDTLKIEENEEKINRMRDM